VRTPVIEKAYPSLFVAEEDKVFAKDPEKLGGVFFRQLLSYGHRMPVPSQQLSGWGSWPYTR
jgi:hypothetical protein